ncbi:MAG: hypothetical protein [Wendovervirus sonii]|uniref:Uncharacterized protein n=1 Tax=phage Lak_Megaphage_Sonny TaxID=3109229 RepID=A0ABZ0Z3W6_9CAUD|nr:MAG: hypothetical protein [phage Lak_Megaphage_Sonny]
MYLFARSYKHFYNEITEAFIELIDEYGLGEKEIDIGYILKTYDFVSENFIDTIKYVEKNKTFETGHSATTRIVEFTKGDESFNIFEMPLSELIVLYEATVFYLLCIEYGISANDIDLIKGDNKKIIIKIFEKDFINGTKATVPIMKSSGIIENSSTINYILQVISTIQTGKPIKKNNMSEDDGWKEVDDIDDDEQLGEITVEIQMKKEKGEYFFNVKNHLFNIDIPEKYMSACELLCLCNTIMKNKGKTF